MLESGKDIPIDVILLWHSVRGRPRWQVRLLWGQPPRGPVPTLPLWSSETLGNFLDLSESLQNGDNKRIHLVQWW